MEKKTLLVNDFVTFEAVEGSTAKCTTVTDADGNETGFEVRGLLTSFDFVNVNGLNFTKESYDDFVENYYIANGLNVPLCILHNDTDIRNVCGYVREMTKEEGGVRIVGFVSKSAYYYKLIRNYIESGVLQGFSNCGGVTDYDFNEDGSLTVKAFSLLHVALVCIPADTSAKFVSNTVFKNFEPSRRQASAEEEDIDLIV